MNDEKSEAKLQGLKAELIVLGFSDIDDNLAKVAEVLNLMAARLGELDGLEGEKYKQERRRLIEESAHELGYS